MPQHDLATGIERLLAGTTYYACLLLVHPDPRELEERANRLHVAYGWARLPVGKELSAALLGEMPARRPAVAQRWLGDRLAELAPGPVLCTEIDLLFEPSLLLDPLALLRCASRLARLIVAWPGSYADDVLTYATPEHAHYRAWRQPDMAVAILD